MRFKWHPDEDPPEIESHSKAKLDVLRSYLRAYFDRLNVNPNREEFKLDLVDGFSGGGTFLSNGDTISGTPLIMLEESESASQRLNRGRARPLKFNCKHYFVDAEQAHTAHLRKVLTDRGYPLDNEKIVLRTSRFEDEVDSIIKGIQSRQQRAGRAIFLLDQTGFSQVALRLVKRIMGELPGAEVILTFAADALINHLSEQPASIKAVAPLELTESLICQMIESRDRDGGRALVQRTLRTHIRSVTGAAFDTPFFIRPLQSRRSLWFVHLSRHPTARDVMIQRHWENLNTFQHYGSGDFGMLGWDALQESESLPLFNFTQADSQQLHEQLLHSVPRKLIALASETPISVEVMRHEFANEIAARYSDLDKVCLQLAQEREIDILRAAGRLRSRSLQHLRPDDRIAFPQTLMLPGISRLRQRR